MKTSKYTTNLTEATHRVIRIAVMMGLGLGTVINPASAENSQMSPAKKAADGKGNLPTFEQADINGDHLVTKSELQNFPYLLQTFDKVDAGNDGKLEQHEYQNLKMETKREGEVK
jgi:hypothetical protein